ncbi:RNA recognition motif domain-containing protein [Ditylenchus destructor]|uniref:RNA recognition motif domain-containing protein n=1 Tax=Ditylenchus destructor TaxID=166010 RepID=A0AAD4N2K7_9BILA|nr:RNA recognition motif domain-containing protein [Ditylenchus destructor]
MHDEEKRAKREEKAQNIIHFVQNLQIRRSRTIDQFPSGSPTNHKNSKKTVLESVSQQTHMSKSASKSFPKLELRKYAISVTGLSGRTSDASLHNFYSQFGDIIRCYILRDGSSRPRGIAVFSSKEARDRALNSLPHRIDNKDITDVKLKACKKELALRVLYLSPRTTVKSLRAFYARFGALAHGEIKKDPVTEKPLGFGYVAFKSEDSLNRCLDAQPHVIDGKEVMLQYLTGELDLAIDELPENINEQSLCTFFSQYGQLRDCQLTKNSIGKTVGYVSFKTLEQVKRVMDDRPHIIEGKRVTTNYSDKQSTHYSLFVGSLPENVTEDSVCEVFSKFGKLVHYNVYCDGQLNQSLPYAFISYANEEQALDALNKGPHMVEGTEVNVRRASEVARSHNTQSNQQSVRHQKIERIEQRIRPSKRERIPKQPAASQANMIQSASKSFPKLELRKYAISVTGLSGRTSNASLQKFYSQFGDLIRCYLLQSNNGKTYGVVVFSSNEARDRALNSLPHRIDDKEITNVIIKARKSELTLRVLYLSPRTTVKSLRAFYDRFGALAHGEIKKDPSTRKSLGFGYVSFLSEDSLYRCLDAQPHVIDGKEVMLQYLTGELDLVVAELPEGITEESLCTFFSQYLPTECKLTRMSSGKPVAHVSFKTLEQVKRVMNDRPHIIEGKRVAISYSGKDPSHYSLFVGSLPENVTEDSVCEVFSKFGKLVHYNVHCDGQLNQSLPYAFISYANEEQALDALNKGPHMVEGTEVNVRRASEVARSHNTQSNPQSVRHQKTERIEQRIRPSKRERIPKQPAASQALEPLSKSPHMVRGAAVRKA